jgi:hypothetical protein
MLIGIIKVVIDVMKSKLVYRPMPQDDPETTPT